MKKIGEIMKIKCSSPTSLLEYLVALGKEAERQLAKRIAIEKNNWEALYQAFCETTDRTITDTSAVDYRRWIARVSDWAERNGIDSPENLTKENAAEAIKVFYGNKASAVRVCRFYRRVWKTLGMDDTIWDVRNLPPSSGKEYYRRLTAGEVNRLMSFLRAKSPDLHDMATIAYYTGLRLSDVVELELSELSPDRNELYIIPNKVKTRRVRKLVVPLVREAKTIVVCRAKSPHEGGKLFKQESRTRVSRKIAAAFKSCSIGKIDSGRASFHSLRSTFISLMDEAGVLPYITDAITGHCAGDMHSRYSQPVSAVLKRSILKAIPPLKSDTASEPWKIGRGMRPDSTEDKIVRTNKLRKKK